MEDREEFIYNLLENIEEMIRTIEDKEVDDEEFSMAREIAEQLRTEIESLQDD